MYKSDEFLGELGPLRGATALSVSETLEVLDAAKTIYTTERRNPPDAFVLMHQHCMRFAKQKNSVSVRESRNAVKHLDVPEATQVYLVDLQPATVEEARSLIPSLARVPDDELARVLEELNQLSQTGQ